MKSRMVSIKASNLKDIIHPFFWESSLICEQDNANTNDDVKANDEDNFVDEPNFVFMSEFVIPPTQDLSMSSLPMFLKSLRYFGMTYEARLAIMRLINSNKHLLSTFTVKHGSLLSFNSSENFIDQPFDKILSDFIYCIIHDFKGSKWLMESSENYYSVVLFFTQQNDLKTFIDILGEQSRDDWLMAFVGCLSNFDLCKRPDPLKFLSPEEELRLMIIICQIAYDDFSNIHSESDLHCSMKNNWNRGSKFIMQTGQDVVLFVEEILRHSSFQAFKFLNEISYFDWFVNSIRLDRYGNKYWYYDQHHLFKYRDGYNKHLYQCHLYYSVNNEDNNGPSRNKKKNWLQNRNNFWFKFFSRTMIQEVENGLIPRHYEGDSMFWDSQISLSIGLLFRWGDVSMLRMFLDEHDTYDLDDWDPEEVICSVGLGEEFGKCCDDCIFLMLERGLFNASTIKSFVLNSIGDANVPYLVQAYNWSILSLEDWVRVFRGVKHISSTELLWEVVQFFDSIKMFPWQDVDFPVNCQGKLLFSVSNGVLLSKWWWIRDKSIRVTPSFDLFLHFHEEFISLSWKMTRKGKRMDVLLSDVLSLFDNVFSLPFNNLGGQWEINAASYLMVEFLNYAKSEDNADFFKRVLDLLRKKFNWFRESFTDALLVFFGQKECPYSFNDPYGIEQRVKRAKKIQPYVQLIVFTWVSEGTLSEAILQAYFQWANKGKDQTFDIKDNKVDKTDVAANVNKKQNNNKKRKSTEM